MNRRAIALLSVGHFLIDLCQGIVPALAPFLVQRRGFSKAEAAGLVFAISATSSVVQPIFGQLADRLTMAWLLPASLLLAGLSLAVGAQASSYAAVLIAFGLSGLGVAAFHPEAARRVNLASGGQRTTGMSFFSIGGGTGFAIAPAITLGMMNLRGMPGLLVLIYPTLIIAGLFVGRVGLAALLGRLAEPSGASHADSSARPAPEGHDDWQAFGILSVATVLRSIVFYGLNTFLALYFMSRWHLTDTQASTAPVVFLGTSIVGTLLGGWLADRFGRRRVMRVGFTGGAVLLAAFLMIPTPGLARVALVPLAIFLFLPTSVLVVMGQEYLPHRVGLASGMTLGLAVSVGGMCAPILGAIGDRRGMNLVLLILLGLLAIAAAQTYALPPVGRRKPAREPGGVDELLPFTADR